jgi:hypothetical protein
MKFLKWINEMAVIVPHHVTKIKIQNRKKKLLAGKDYVEIVKQLNNLFRAYHTKFIVKAITSNSAMADENVEAALIFPDLTIEFRANSSFYEFMRIPEWFDYAVNTIEDMIWHELVHHEQILRAQINPKEFKTDNMKLYLSQPNEIMAYAAQISLELKNERLSKDTALRAIRQNKKVLTDHCHAYALYAIFFSEESDVWRRLNKCIFQYIEKW